MATIVSAGGGAVVTRLASLTNIPKTSTAVSGTENWKKYDAIYFECFMHYSGANETAVFTNLILTTCVSLGDRYQPIRVSTSSGNGAELDIYCNFSENKINMSKDSKAFDLSKLEIYGVNF